MRCFLAEAVIGGSQQAVVLRHYLRTPGSSLGLKPAWSATRKVAYGTRDLLTSKNWSDSGDFNSPMQQPKEPHYGEIRRLTVETHSVIYSGVYATRIRQLVPDVAE